MFYRICLCVKQHLLTDTLALQRWTGRQHTNASAGRTSLHMHARYDFRPETQEQNRRPFMKQRKHLLCSSSFTRNQICFVSPPRILRRRPVSSVDQGSNFLGVGFTSKTKFDFDFSAKTLGTH